MRLPHTFTSRAGARSVDTTGRHRHSEMLVDSLRAQRSLEPERLASPIERTSRRATLPWPIAILLASAWRCQSRIICRYSWDPPPGLGPQIASSDQTIVASHSNATLESRSTTAQDQHVETSVPEITSSARVRQPEHPRARRWRCCRGASPNRLSSGKSQPHP